MDSGAAVHSKLMQPKGVFNHILLYTSGLANMVPSRVGEYAITHPTSVNPDLFTDFKPSRNSYDISH
ncbi:hypothetical protein H0H81_002871 [Sphagnurus paluster]|uniref:Uncharacterized protein n=1 Tax=Sphagnurus paluster TaxID=117069 RepID=A0A9P7GMT0_9AGAR|nr:hypothetical protein H0H81_002871 [Sphagnurus paluster]